MLLNPNKINITLCGMMGSGKSIVGKRVAKNIDFNFIDTDQLIQEIHDVELCARPAAEYRDKVFSNLKYRANRLKTCVQMIKQGELGFDCSREFKKTVKANGGENCFKKLEVMKKSFKNFETLFSGYQSCLKTNKN